MVAATPIPEITDDGPVSYGVYYFDEVARLLSVGDSDFYIKPPILKYDTVWRWSNSGYFQASENPFEGNRKYVTFGSLVTARMIALLLSYGISARQVHSAHDLLAERTGSEMPFVGRRFWTEAPELAREVHVELDGLVVTASKDAQMPITDFLHGRVRDACRMDFDEDTDMPLLWHPSEGVTIDPMLQSGAPCVAGTGTATHYLYESYLGGDSVEDLVYWCELSELQVSRALRWEQRLS